jgi:hypothetical protein
MPNKQRMNEFMSEQISVHEKRRVLEKLKDGCLSYLEMLLALKDKNNLIFTVFHLPVRHLD